MRLADARRRRAMAMTRCSSPTGTSVTFGRNGPAAEKNRISHRAVAFWPQATGAAGAALRRDRHTTLRQSGRGLARRGGFGVYVHWPFCAAKCPYCDFNSHVARRRSTRPAGAAPIWPRSQARRRETPGRGAEHGLLRRRHASLMPPETVAAVLEAIARGLAAGATDAEITLEANPDLGRGRAVPRLSRGRGEPAVAWAFRP